ncbi:undecaprenyl-diphosphatase [Paenisporosarcina quisquiliarum]|uniref:phosphatase PAP2 family protein n=1 Tax=Psychrobacillus psychrodurans TaxID=126157 RepID=UPI0008ADFC7F|nr:phosphatase PAP2 family protein [Psychrobacillus psychrodurans]MCZ8539786.1 phosphatase PAP2 family protein [Psychrobacillus psychrodurans]SEN68418.1 undecaprenyl-diphosphatase [Paenisporosarcina quisquiliarum]SFM92500.1 undecaprenyl-diphosphatase [Psychrobacillus psychrodurans]
MNKSKYVIAVFTFVVFCIIWMTYETSFIQSFDRIASDLLYGNKFITMFHYLGETKFIFAVTIIVLIIIWFRKHDYRLTVFVIFSVGAGYGLYQFLKRVIERPRPEIVDQFFTFSFPSGHAVHGLLYLLTIAYLINQTVIISKKASIIVWISAIILTLLIGLSRITEGRHFASDVLAGWMLGYSWFVLCLWWYKRGNRERNK